MHLPKTEEESHPRSRMLGILSEIYSSGGFFAKVDHNGRTILRPAVLYRRLLLEEEGVALNVRPARH